LLDSRLATSADEVEEKKPGGASVKIPSISPPVLGVYHVRPHETNLYFRGHVSSRSGCVRLKIPPQPSRRIDNRRRRGSKTSKDRRRETAGLRGLAPCIESLPAQLGPQTHSMQRLMQRPHGSKCQRTETTSKCVRSFIFTIEPFSVQLNK
jgi:hypothetical protein